MDVDYNRHATPPRARSALLAVGCIRGRVAKGSKIDTAEQAFVVGVQFHPGGAWPFMQPGQDEVSDAHFALRDVGVPA